MARPARGRRGQNADPRDARACASRCPSGTGRIRRGYQHAQSAGTDAVVEGHLHRRHFAVGSHQQMLVPRFDPEGMCGPGSEVPALPQPSEERGQGEPDQAPPVAPLRHINAQAAAVQAPAPADIESLHLILVIPNENERRAAMLLDLVQAEPDVEERRAAQHGYDGPEYRMPFSLAEPLLL